MSNTAQMSAKHRIAALLDDNSFVEVGALVTRRSTDFNLQQKEVPADGVITGYGLIDGSLVYVYSQDASAMNGSVGEMHAKKIVHLYDLALKVGAPVIGLVDCAGLRLQEATDALAGFGEIYRQQTMASGVIPQITAIFGHCGGGLAVSASLSDFVFMEEKSAKLFVNSPNVLAGNYTDKCDTGAAGFHYEAGNVDYVGEDEASVLAKVRELVSILPSNNEDNDSYEECADDLNRLTESFAAELSDTSLALRDLSDNGFFFETKAGYAKEMVTGFIRLNGMTIGAVANRREVLGEDGKAVDTFDGTLTCAGCYKAERFVRFCDAFDIPVLTLTNVTGYRATVSEEKGMANAAARLTGAFAQATVPKVNLILEKAYGSAYITMNSRHIGADMVFALEGAEVGMMDARLAAQIMYAGEPESMDPSVLKQKAEEYRQLQLNAVSAARRGYIDAVISGESARKHLIYAFDMLFTKRESRPAKKHGTV